MKSFIQKIKYLNWSKCLSPVVCIIFVILIVTPGCKILLPAHPNSDARAGEEVAVEMLTRDDIQSKSSFNPLDPLKPIRWDANYALVFGQDVSEAANYKVLASTCVTTNDLSLKEYAEFAKAAGQIKPMVIPPMIVGAAVGFAVDYVKKELEEEATRYEAQFKGTVTDDAFWRVEREVKDFKLISTANGTNTVKFSTDTFLWQRYFGFRVTRKIKGELAFELVCGIAPSKDKQFLKIAPLYTRTTKAKAKILSNKLYQNLHLIPVLMRWPTEEIEQTVHVEMTGFWKKNQDVNVTTLAGSDMFLYNYNLGKRSAIVPEKENDRASGWISSVPYSVDSKGEPLWNDKARDHSLGVFTLKVTVTERDPSNAKQKLESAAKLVGDNKDKLKKLLSPDE
jgi:hypothetical protein